MIGYILIGIGAWLVYDDIKAKKLAIIVKEGGKDGVIHKNGDDSSGSDSTGKSGKLRQKSDRDRSIGIPVKKLKKGDSDNGISKKPVHKVKPDKNSDSSGNDSTGKPDAATAGDQGKSLKNKSKSKEGGQDAGTENDHENGAGHDGDNVHLESGGRDESNGAETD